MAKQRWLAVLLFHWLAASTVGAAAPVVYERDAKALAALVTMGSQLRALPRFQIDAQSTTDQVLDTGQTLQFAHRTRLKAQPPSNAQPVTLLPRQVVPDPAAQP